MKKNILLFITTSLVLMSSGIKKANAQATDVDIWKLGWRMIASSMDENYELANLQFDSLRASTGVIDIEFLGPGLEVKSKLESVNEINDILKSLDKRILPEICTKDFLSTYEICKGHSVEKVDNSELQMQLVKMYIEDQAARGNLMENIILKNNIDSAEVSKDGTILVDERNRKGLKEIIAKHGFPTRKLVGKDAMRGIFFIIQHSDRDKEWPKSQFSNIEQAVKAGDMDGQWYAYLYDRIKINSGEKQLYGTQFAKVDVINKIVVLADTEDLENLDKRRMEIGMMPIQMYKDFMLRNL